MKTNEARPIFRTLSALIALPMWITGILTMYSIIQHGSSIYFNWELVIGMLFGAFAFSYVAIAGYMPKSILQVFSRGPAADDKHLK